MRSNVRKRTWHRFSLGTIAFVCATGLLSACSSNEVGPTTAEQSGSDFASVSMQSVEAPDWGHAHNVSLVGDVVYIGSHYGFWRQESGQKPVLISQPAFDVMGLAGTNQRWLASGHPGPDMDAPSDLGLIESTDNGTTWQSVSLLGEVDFHRLIAVNDLILGVSAHDNSLFRSTNGGQTWRDLGTTLIFDFAINPTNPDSILATTANGAIASLDGGITFTPVTTPTPLMLLAWNEEGLYAVSVDGQVFFSQDGGSEWVERGTLGGGAADLAADADTVVAIVNNSILSSTDGGLTFNTRIKSAGSHSN